LVATRTTVSSPRKNSTRWKFLVSKTVVEIPSNSGIGIHCFSCSRALFIFSIYRQFLEKKVGGLRSPSRRAHHQNDKQPLLACQSKASPTQQAHKHLGVCTVKREAPPPTPPTRESQSQCPPTPPPPSSYPSQPQSTRPPNLATLLLIPCRATLLLAPPTHRLTTPPVRRPTTTTRTSPPPTPTTHPTSPPQPRSSTLPPRMKMNEMSHSPRIDAARRGIALRL
jgi:hypothetical protein